jgi:cytochrome c
MLKPQQPGLRGRAVCSALALVAWAAVGAAHAAGDASRGKDVFAQECGDCHSGMPGKDKKGPALSGIIGRHAGSVSAFAGYSAALKASEITWSPEKLDAYITAPKKLVPGGKMKYDGLGDAAARADLLAYLLSLK